MPSVLRGELEFPPLFTTSARTSVAKSSTFVLQRTNLGVSLLTVCLDFTVSLSGMMLGGGCGRELAHWIIHGRPEKDMYGYDIRYQDARADPTEAERVLGSGPVRPQSPAGRSVVTVAWE